MPRTHQFLVTLTVHTNKINPATPPTATSAALMTNGHPVVVIHRDGQQRSGSVDTRIDKAVKALRRDGADITISSVARRAGVTRNSIHRRKDVLARIRAHQPLAAVTDDIPPAPH
ncbi:MAG: hypothetical protein HYX32_15110, partial [Actinobacteria bacterium]|nr:hypothetical protein [Actinomycetota bacterium]